jgi:hypothetical protein
MPSRFGRGAPSSKILRGSTFTVYGRGAFAGERVAAAAGGFGTRVGVVLIAPLPLEPLVPALDAADAADAAEAAGCTADCLRSNTMPYPVSISSSINRTLRSTQSTETQMYPGRRGRRIAEDLLLHIGRQLIKRTNRLHQVVHLIQDLLHVRRTSIVLVGRSLQHRSAFDRDHASKRLVVQRAQALILSRWRRTKISPRSEL